MTDVDVKNGAGETVGTVPIDDDPPSLAQRIVAVKRDIGAVGKAERNSAQGFNFRGIDAVLNAVSPALIKHGIVVYPRVQSVEKGTATTAKGSIMNTVVVVVEYIFTDGDESIASSAAGEAFDSGDKAVAKAMSVAYRTALIQALSLPTDEPDPDHEVYDAQPVERIVLDGGPMQALMSATTKQEVRALWAKHKVSQTAPDVQAKVQAHALTLPEGAA
jgi:hypothetical protein